MSVEMRVEAERFCSIIERAELLPRSEFVAGVAQALAELVAAVGRMRAVEPSDAELPGRPSRDAVRDRFGGVQSVLGDWGGYWTSLVPVGDGENEAVMLPLADDLADVWADVKHGLVALELGASDVDVLWEWRFGFYSHWGRHATEALRAIHARLADDGGPPGGCGG